MEPQYHVRYHDFLWRHGWTKDIQHFPHCFLKSIPKRKPEPTPMQLINNVNRSTHYDPSPPPMVYDSAARLSLTLSSGCVLTNASGSQRLTLDDTSIGILFIEGERDGNNIKLAPRALNC